MQVGNGSLVLSNGTRLCRFEIYEWCLQVRRACMFGVHQCLPVECAGWKLLHQTKRARLFSVCLVSSGRMGPMPSWSSGRMRGCLFSWLPGRLFMSSAVSLRLHRCRVAICGSASFYVGVHAHIGCHGDEIADAFGGGPVW